MAFGGEDGRGDQRIRPEGERPGHLPPVVGRGGDVPAGPPPPLPDPAPGEAAVPGGEPGWNMKPPGAQPPGEAGVGGDDQAEAAGPADAGEGLADARPLRRPVVPEENRRARRQPGRAMCKNSDRVGQPVLVGHQDQRRKTVRAGGQIEPPGDV